MITMSKTIQTPLRWNPDDAVDRECIEWLEGELKKAGSKKTGMATLIKSIIVCHVREQKRLQALNELTKQLKGGAGTQAGSDLVALLTQALQNQQHQERKDPEPEKTEKQKNSNDEVSATSEETPADQYAQIEADNLPF
jgi:hypothetical protein